MRKYIKEPFRFRLKIAGLHILFALILPYGLWAETTNTPPFLFSEGGPLAISSEKMSLKGQEDKVLFEGTVLIQRGDIKITAGRVEVQLGDKDQEKSTKLDAPAEGKEIIQIEMMEKVEIQQGDRRVLAQKGIYNPKKGEIVLTGDAEMWEKGYHVQGKLIRLSLTDKKSFVEGSILTIY